VTNTTTRTGGPVCTVRQEVPLAINAEYLYRMPASASPEELAAAGLEGCGREAFNLIQDYVAGRLHEAAQGAWVPEAEMPALANSFLVELEEAVALVRHRLQHPVTLPLQVYAAWLPHGVAADYDPEAPYPPPLAYDVVGTEGDDATAVRTALHTYGDSLVSVYVAAGEQDEGVGRVLWSSKP
jgi:hypothetical protein